MHRTASHSKYLPGPKCQCYRWETLPQRELSWNRYIAPPHICGRCASLSPWSKYEDSRKLLGWLGQGSLEFGRHKYQYLIPSWKNSEEERLREAIGDTRGGGGRAQAKNHLCALWTLRVQWNKNPCFSGLRGPWLQSSQKRPSPRYL